MDYVDVLPGMTTTTTPPSIVVNELLCSKTTSLNTHTMGKRNDNYMLTTNATVALLTTMQVPSHFLAIETRQVPRIISFVRLAYREPTKKMFRPKSHP